MAVETVSLSTAQVIDRLVEKAIVPHMRETDVEDRAKELKVRMASLVVMLIAEPPSISPRVEDALRKYPHIFTDQDFQDMLVKIVESHAERQ